MKTALIQEFFCRQATSVLFEQEVRQRPLSLRGI